MITGIALILIGVYVVMSKAIATTLIVFGSLRLAISALSTLINIIKRG